jgi:hypothetical protein
MANCPFCGVATDIAHETQESCIQALHAEIARMRAVLHHVQSAKVPVPSEPEDDELPETGQTRD